jgi:hypothetical protein
MFEQCVHWPLTLLQPHQLRPIVTIRHLYPLAKVDLPLFVDDFHRKMNLVLDKKAYIFVLTHFPCLSFGNPSSMVYELL